MQNDNEMSCLALLSSSPRPYIPLSSYPLSMHPSAKGLAYNHTAFAAGVVSDVLYHNFNLPAEYNNVIRHETGRVEMRLVGWDGQRKRQRREWWLGEKARMDPLDPQLAMHVMIDCGSLAPKTPSPE
jgi:hypothetical protein